MLKQKIVEEWSAITPDIFKKLIFTMLRRIIIKICRWVHKILIIIINFIHDYHWHTFVLIQNLRVLLHKNLVNIMRVTRAICLDI